nr:choice-of-anchor B family protein [Calditrichia bacterium]
ERDFVSGPFSIWKDIKTYQHYAYVVTEADHNLQVIDLANLPGPVSLVGNFPVFITDPHNISIDTTNGFLYGAEDNQFGQSVRVISLADPVNPVSVTAFGTDCHDMLIQDNILYVAEGTNGTIGIYDMSDPAHPALLVRIPIPNPGYVHNVWPTEDGQYLVSTEETSGKTVKIWDIRDLANVELKSEYLAPERLAHNAHVKGNYVHLAHYRDGLRILDISDPTNMHEVAYYDTYPGSGGIYEGDWGAFPFFASNLTVASDQTTGLYIFRFPDTGVGIEPSENIAGGFALGANYPNPFNPSTTIPFSLSSNARATVEICNVLGQTIVRLGGEILAAGDYQFQWDGHSAAGNVAPSGVYFYRLKIDGQIRATRSMILSR